MKDIGNVSYVLELKALKVAKEKLLGLSQRAYIRKICKQFWMRSSKPVCNLIEKYMS